MINVSEKTHFDGAASIHRLATIGPDCWIGAGVCIGEHVVIGAGCVIKPGAVIGFDGFGYERDGDGRWTQKPSTFGVDIGDDVHIGAGTCIDRGSWRDTVIGPGVRIDNLVHVAHNVLVCRDVVIVAHAGLGGSVVVEEGAWIGFGAHVHQRVRIGFSALVGMGAAVLKDVAPNTTVAGVPARVINEEVGVRARM